LHSEIEASWSSFEELLQKHAGKIAHEEKHKLLHERLSSILEFTKTKGSDFLFEPLLSYELRMMSDITRRATKEFLRLGTLKGWGRVDAEIAPQ
jgi:hypothetical protein